MTQLQESKLVVRRSIHIKAKPNRVWEEFRDFERMNRWWGVMIGSPEAGSGNGQRLMTYEPRKGGKIEMEVLFKGVPVRYGGKILEFSPNRELTFECDWIPNQGWLHPTLLTIRLTEYLGGTLVELLHHGFEQVGEHGSEEHAGYEGGWGMLQLSTLRKLVDAA